MFQGGQNTGETRRPSALLTRVSVDASEEPFDAVTRRLNRKNTKSKQSHRDAFQKNAQIMSPEDQTTETTTYRVFPRIWQRQNRGLQTGSVRTNSLNLQRKRGESARSTLLLFRRRRDEWRVAHGVSNGVSNTSLMRGSNPARRQWRSLTADLSDAFAVFTFYY